MFSAAVSLDPRMVLFPDRCSHNVPGKALAGFATGLAMAVLEVFGFRWVHDIRRVTV